MASLGLIGGLLGSAVGVGIGQTAASAATVSVSSFTNNFSAMTALKSLAKSGHGKVAVILPDTVSSARYTQFDAPYLTKAFQKAGLSSSQFQRGERAGQ